MEVIVAHLVLEHYLRRWLASVPVDTLFAIFETDSTVVELTSAPPGPEELARMADRQARRMALARWPASAHRRAVRPRRKERARDQQIRNNRYVVSRGQETEGRS